MGLRLVPNLVTLTDLERRDAVTLRYYAERVSFYSEQIRRIDYR